MAGGQSQAARPAEAAVANAPAIAAAPIDEKSAMLAALAECRGKRAKAARRLGMSRSTFYRRLAEYGIGEGED